MTDDLKEQIRKAQAEMATWSEDKRKSVRLEGTDLWLSVVPMPSADAQTFVGTYRDVVENMPDTSTQGADARPVASIENMPDVTEMSIHMFRLIAAIYRPKQNSKQLADDALSYLTEVGLNKTYTLQDSAGVK